MARLFFSVITDVAASHQAALKIGLHQLFRRCHGGTGQHLNIVLFQQTLRPGSQATGYDQVGLVFGQPLGEYAGLMRDRL